MSIIHRPAGRASRQAGQALPLGVAALLVACLVLAQLGRFGAAAVRRAQLQAAADAVALAGASAGASDAARIAALNGVSLVAYRQSADARSVQVEVERDGDRAEATAADEWLGAE